ncbi:rCG31709 [Rattus norvegicus]|uniref:RCG31709 n=1 Tax=Rattus norvegicus TaxID=10116 RepID=A6JNE0_RAT|nr:rCG31709 [Rattus norvegicus]
MRSFCFIYDLYVSDVIFL